MAGRERRADRAMRAARADLRAVGREMRQARLAVDLSQRAASAAAGVSKSAWSRLERGDEQVDAIVRLARMADVLGLDLRLRMYPGGSPVRDAAHLALLERLRRHLPPAAAWHTEVPLPNAGDRRAWDALVRVESVRIGIEAETRGRDSQELQRRLALKRRDGGVDHLILLLADTRHNRSFLRAAGTGLLADFPVPGSVALERLAAGRDPGGSAILLL